MFSPGNISDEGYDYHYFYRPGHKDFLLRLQAHPRIKLAFYSSMLEKNILPILSYLLTPDLDVIREELQFFDQNHCRRMHIHPLYKKLQSNPYKHYRDLKLVFSDPFCVKHQFSWGNTIMIDSESGKI